MEYKETEAHTHTHDGNAYKLNLVPKQVIGEKDRVVIERPKNTRTHILTHTTAYLTCCIPEKIDMVQPLMNGLTLNKATRRPRFCATHIASLHLMVSAMSTKHSFVLLLTRIAIFSNRPCHMCFSFSFFFPTMMMATHRHYQVSSLSPTNPTCSNQQHDDSIITPIFSKRRRRHP